MSVATDILLAPDVRPFAVAAAIMVSLGAIELLTMIVGFSISELVGHDFGLDSDSHNGIGGLFLWINAGRLPLLILIILALGIFSAPNIARQIQAGTLLKLDKSKLPNLVNAWPEIADRLAGYDPGNQYAANYMWGTTGIGYNVKTVQKILGPDARIDSWDIVFKPENLAKFGDCGIHMLDSADDIFPAALSYLGLDPNSTKRPDLEKAADLVVIDDLFLRKLPPHARIER